MLEVRLLGTFDIRLKKKPVAISSRPAQSLFAYLILSAGTSHRREKLAGLLWPDSLEETARDNLRHALWRVRKALQAASAIHLLRADDLTIQFEASSDYWLDTAALENLSESAPADESMAVLADYQGELLPGFYDEWVVLEREHLQATFEHHMARLLSLLERENRWLDILDWGERWIKLGQRPEPAYRALMSAHAAKGDMSKVAATYERCVKSLKEFGIEPSKQTHDLHERLKAGKETFETVTSFPLKEKRKESVRASLPTPLTSFIGREKEVREVVRLLGKNRLVTLMGPGGVGKTRLAIQSCNQLLSQFKAGIRWVDLAPLIADALIPQAVAQVLGIREHADQPLIESVKSFLREKKMLLILDNCEHLITACAQLADSMLSDCKNLKILATSREALDIMGERVYEVPTLSLPKERGLTPINMLMTYEGIQLFVERASTIKSDFELTEQNAATVLQICQRLDGIPLALELAAARTKLLTVEHIAERLNDRFNLLTHGSRTALPRQQTLRAAIDWSYDLLPEEACILFRRLSIFAGGFTLEAAEEICSAAPLASHTVLDLMARLLDRSLVKMEQQGEHERYRMLETMREYALDKLRASGEFGQIRDRHLAFFLQFVEHKESKLQRGIQIELSKMEAEHDNIRTALDWSLGRQEQLGTGMRLAGATYWFWDIHGMWSEARRWLETLLAHAIDPPRQIRAKLQILLGAIIFNQSGPEKAHALMEQSLANWRELQDKWWISFALYQLGWVDLYQRDLEAASSHFEECIGLARELSDDFLLGRALHSMGGLLRRTNSTSAIPILEEGLSVARRSEDKRLMIQQLYHLGLTESVRGNIAATAKYYEEGLALAKEVGDRGGIAELFSRLGVDVVLLQGNLDKAEALILDGLELAVELGMDVEIAFDLAWLGYVATARQQLHRSAQLFGASEARFGKLGLSMSVWPDRVKTYNEYLDRTRAQLGEAAFAKAWAEGRAMSMEEAIELALKGLPV